VQTTQAGLKQSFRNLERAMQQLEAASAVTGRVVGSEELWKTLIFAQFHDFVPGSSVHEVYDEEVPALDEAAAIATDRAAALLSGDDGALCFNPHALPMTTARIVDGRVETLIVPALATGDWREATVAKVVCSVDGKTLRSDRVEARFSDAGEIEFLEFDGRPVSICQPLNQLRIYPDHPANFEAWDIDRQTVSNPIDPIGPVKLIKSENTELEARLEFEVPLTVKSSARFTYVVRCGSPVLHVNYSIDWQDQSHLLQALFPTGYSGRDARFGAPFGSALRPQIETTLGADAQFEVPASRWGVVADECERAGLAVIAKDRYGFGCRDGVMHVSLLRSAFVTDARRNPELRARDYPHDFSDLGSHNFELALAWGGLDQPREDQPAALADLCYTPAIKAGSTVPQVIKSISGGATLIPAWVKPADDGQGFILRLHETRGQRGDVQFGLADGWCAFRTSAIEGTSTPLEEGVLKFTPHDICSIRICRVDP
ncbi:MAG: glycoside hydrolase family 38 C-terminal domain-containing protein, partial [Chthoniobacterales bacterium]